MKAIRDYYMTRFGFVRRDEGATAVEYGIMVALIAIVIIIAVIALGENLAAIFQDVANTLEDPIGS